MFARLQLNLSATGACGNAFEERRPELSPTPAAIDSCAGP